jgi:sec-independent protein translocase protein TatC
MGLIDHLQELRWRILASLAFIAAATVAMYFASSWLLFWLDRPLGGLHLVAFGPVDGFTIRLQLAFWSGLVLSSPFWLYQLLSFILPGLTGGERRVVVPALISVVVLFLVGALAGYLLLNPALRFLMAQFGSQIRYLPSVTAYINMALFFMIAMGLSFQFPVVMVTLMALGLVRPEFFRKHRKVGYFAMFAFAELVTPVADPIVLPTLVFLPLLLLYEGAIALGRWLALRRRSAAATSSS